MLLSTPSGLADGASVVDRHGDVGTLVAAVVATPPLAAVVAGARVMDAARELDPPLSLP